MKRLCLTTKWLFVIVLLLTLRLSGAAITVINTSDTGAGSLRDALDRVENSISGSETVNFNIPGSGVHIIKPATPLPFITNTVVINGYSQPGSHPNTLAQGDDAAILIEIDGQLTLAGDRSEVYGLAVQEIELAGYGDTVQGNFIGADTTGTNNIPSTSGAASLSLRASFAHQIGGIHPADRNLISGNSYGITGFDAQNPFGPLGPTVIEGNYIGTDRTGTKPLTGAGLGNSAAGISISATDQIIGGTDPGAGNIIAFNGVGVQVQAQGRANNQLIEGNSIFANPGGGITGGNNGPLVTSATPGSTVVKGIVTGTPGNSYRVEIFSNDACDPSGFGQGRTLIGFGEASLDATGQGDFTATLSVPLSADTPLTATATPVVNAGEGTSNFSRCMEVAPPLDLALTVSGPTAPTAALSNATFDVTVSNNSAQTATAVALTAQLPSTLSIVSFPAGWTNQSVFQKNGPALNVISTLVPSLAAGASVSGTIIFKPKLIGSYISSFQIEGGQSDENQTNNRLQLTTSVFNPAPRQLVVTNTADSGLGSLAQAITDVNNGVGGDMISFNIPGSGVHQITTTSFSSINVPVTVDGYTQPGAKPNTLPTGDNAVLKIELTQSGLLFESGTCTVRGLIIPTLNFFGQSGSTLAGGSNAVEGCFIGTDPTGLHASTNLDYNLNPVAKGISIQEVDDTRIGGPAPAQRNIISAVSGHRVTTSTGEGVSPAAITSDSARTVIQGNYIGTDATGQNSLGNNGSSILFGSGPNGVGPVNGGLVGGTNSGEGNIIAYNTGAGVNVADPRSNVSILGNSIFGNGAIGISLGRVSVSVLDPPLNSGINGLAIAATITNVTQTGSATRVQGYLQALANEAYRLEFFASPSNSNAFIQSEGKTLLGSETFTTDAHGQVLFDSNLPASPGLISATATDSAGSTSTFFTFYRPGAATCLTSGDLLISTKLGALVATNATITHAVQSRDQAGKALGILYRRDSGWNSAENQPIRDVGVANSAVWIVDSGNGTVYRTSLCGEPLGMFLQQTNVVPFCITFDANSNVYIGFSGTNNSVKKFDATGKLLDQYPVYCDYALGVIGMDLAADQHTLFYGAYGTKIHRYDLATHQQLSDFATNSLDANYFRILPDGGVVTADDRGLRRYDAAGKGVWTKFAYGNYFWVALRLDPDQKTFWALDASATLVHFDLTTGARLDTIAADVQNYTELAGGLAVVGEPVAALSGKSVQSGPSLKISSTGSQTLLSWTTSATGFAVQSSPIVGSGATWQLFGSTPLGSNGQFTVPINPSEPSRFFRLLK